MSRGIILVIIFVIIVDINSIIIQTLYQKTFSVNAVTNDVEFKELLDNNRTIVQNTVKQQVPLTSFVSDPSDKTNEVFESFYEKVKSPAIFRMKVWDTNYRVIWSNLKELIGSKFQTNDEVKEALEGNVGVEITLNGQGESEIRESITENLFNNYTEIYIPIKSDSGKIVGVVEIYQSIESILSRLQMEFYKTAIITVGISLVVLAASYFTVKKFIK